MTEPLCLTGTWPNNWA